MAKLDLKREHKDLYAASANDVAVVEVPPLSYLMVNGSGDPNSNADYVAAIEALFSLSYALKFAIKKGPVGLDYVVMPLEGQWWVEDLKDFSYTERSGWRWTAMILQPSAVTADLVAEQSAAVAKKKNPAALPLVRFAELVEGPSAQILHLGPFSEEPPTIERLHAEIAARGLRPVGKHHEIYLSDVSRTAPEKLRTILRQPVAPA
jgi:hypothetical protein